MLGIRNFYVMCKQGFNNDFLFNAIQQKHKLKQEIYKFETNILYSQSCHIVLIFEICPFWEAVTPEHSLYLVLKNVHNFGLCPYFVLFLALM